jgi:hypothetical protein
MAIAKAYPELVKSITLAKDRYSPIILNGIIIKDDNDTLRYSTNLEFHLDYQTASNQPVSIKFATGEDVSVNCLLGMSFIKAAKLIIDSHDNVVESKLLECEPFAIEYKQLMRSRPNLIQRNQPSTEKNLAVINAIDEACIFILTYAGSAFISTGNRKPTVARNIRYGIHETPIMQKAIKSLLLNDQIEINDDSSWLSRIVLAPKPHQEEVLQIFDFIWRFCISYIALNQVTKVISYYIPRCDDAVENGFGKARLFNMMDACSGFHQIKIERTSSKKTAFAGPYGQKYQYKVMPFGLVNAPTIFVTMIYDLKSD